MDESNPCDAALAELLTLTVEVNQWGTTIYCIHLGKLHRIHGPAVIHPGGRVFWWLRGQQLTESEWKRCVALENT